MNGKSQNLPPVDVVNITNFQNQQGFYYHQLGKLKTSYADWQLISYIDLDQYTTKYLALLGFYNNTSQLCSELRQKLENTDVTYNCRQFAQATIPYLYEIEVNHQDILSSIGHNHNTNDRIRRGLRNAVSRLANVLYGSLENIDIGFVFSKIVQLTQNNRNNANLASEKLSIFQTKIEETNSTLINLLTNQNKLEQNLQVLREQIRQNTQKIDQITIKTTLLEQTLLFETMLNQYAYETQNLLITINAALHGKLHSNILHVKRWLSELKEIKANLPAGTALPLEIRPDSIAEFRKISEVVVVHKDKYLIFIIKIPLVLNSEFNVFNIVTLPTIFNNQNLILFETEIDILAISHDKETFFVLTNDEWERCRNSALYKICKNSQAIHHKNDHPSCEISPLIKPQNLPDHCKIKYVTSNLVVWNRLAYSNSWLFFTQPETITIVCENPTRVFTFEIYGVGRLTISLNCVLHTDQFTLLPLNQVKTTTINDIIPENYGTIVKQSLKDLLHLVFPQNYTNVQVIKDLNKFTHSLKNLSELEKRPSEPPLIVTINIHIILLYSCIIYVITLSIFLLIKFKKTFIKLYKPDLPETELSENINV